LSYVFSAFQYKLDSLSQQLSLAKEESERAIDELNQNSDEFSKYRRAKHAELLEVQAEHDSLTQTSATSESSIKALQAANKSLSQQLIQALTHVQDLTGQLAEQEATYSSEAVGLRRLVVMMEERERHAKEIVDGLERDWVIIGEKAERRETKLKDEIEREVKRADDAEKRVREASSRIGYWRSPLGTLNIYCCRCPPNPWNRSLNSCSRQCLCFPGRPWPDGP
jgi:nucleoprotein TPR